MFTNFCIFLLTLVFSLIRFLILEVVYLLTMPIRIFLNLIITHPFTLMVIALLSVLTCTVFVVIVKQISIVKVCCTLFRLIAPYICRLAHTLFLYLCPQYYLLLSVVHFMLAPVKFLFDLFFCFPQLFPSSYQRRIRRISRGCGDDTSRIMCCVCFVHEKSILLQPCNHICLCADCAEELLETYEEPLCPLCRSFITSYVDVYI